MEPKPLGCGPRALSIAARLLGRDVAPLDIVRAFAGNAGGPHSYAEVEAAARALGLHVASARIDPSSPSLGWCPTLIAVRRPTAGRDEHHFLLLFGSKGDTVQVLDYPRPPEFVPRQRLAGVWDGQALFLAVRASDLPVRLEMCRWQRWLVVTSGLAVTIVGVSLLLWPRTRGAAKPTPAADSD
jgi:hypothetical protein